MTLNGLYQLGTSALSASRTALSVTGDNMANVNTPGYSRRRAVLSPAASVFTPIGTFGTGVDVASVRSLRDQLLETRLHDQLARFGLADQRQKLASDVELILDEASANGIGNHMSELFNAFESLGTDAASFAFRQEVVSNASSLASSISADYASLVALRRDDDRVADSYVREVNALVEQIADLNVEVVSFSGGGNDPGSVRDERDRLVRELSELVEIDVVDSGSGEVSLHLAGTGDALVQGGLSTPLEVRRDLQDGFARIVMDRGNGDVDVTDGIRGGRLGGVFEHRDDIVPGFLDDLDRLATALIEEFNAVHRQGFNLLGETDVALFVPDPPGSSPAASLAVNPDLVDDPNRLAAAGIAGAPSDGSIALELGSLRDETIGSLDDELFTGFVGTVAARAGTSAAAANNAVDIEGATLTLLLNERDSVSAVDLDEEAVDLIRYQESYQAAAQFISVVNDLTQIALDAF